MVREHRFDPTRRWRFDAAWPEAKLAVEIEGSGHRNVVKFRKDTEKYNTAVRLGWRILRFQGCDYKPSRSRDVYPRGAADWAEEALGVLCECK
jgi:very-short-patch-repair endonuclease